MSEAQAHFDLIVIGAGPAGRSAAMTAASFGAKVAIIEQNPLGGVMAVDSIAGVLLREIILRHHNQRVPVHAFRKNVFRESLARAAHAQQVLREQVGIDLLRRGITYIEGAARYVSPRSVQVDSGRNRQVHETHNIVIATGAQRIAAPGIPLDDPDVLDVSSLLRQEQLPDDILILGDDATALAIATLLAELGVGVTLVLKRNAIILEIDAETAQALWQHFRNAGGHIHFGVRICTVERVDGALQVNLDEQQVLNPSAVGYTPELLPSTGGLGLLAASVKVNGQGYIEVDPYFRTSAHGIYAVGDVASPTGANEIAVEQGRAAACHIFARATREYVNLMPIRHVHGIPELAGVGLTEEQCKLQGLACFVGRSELNRTMHGLITGDQGQLKLIFDRNTRQLLGVHCIGDDAVNLVSIGQGVMHYGGTIEAFDALVPIETSCAYAYHDAARDAHRNLNSA